MPENFGAYRQEMPKNAAKHYFPYPGLAHDKRATIYA